MIEHLGSAMSQIREWFRLAPTPEPPSSRGDEIEELERRKDQAVRAMDAEIRLIQRRRSRRIHDA